MTDPIPPAPLNSLRQSLRPGKGRGRPTDENWSHKARVPMSQETRQHLLLKAGKCGIGYTQAAARLLEDAVAREKQVKTDEARQQLPEMPRPAVLRNYAVKLLRANRIGSSRNSPAQMLQDFSENDWREFILDTAFEPQQIRDVAHCLHAPAGDEVDGVWKVVCGSLNSTGPHLPVAAAQLQTEIKVIESILVRILPDVVEHSPSPPPPRPRRLGCNTSIKDLETRPVPTSV